MKNALLLAVLLVPLAQAQTPDTSWSRFRGPNGSGVTYATGLPESLDPATNQLWRKPLPPGHSSPILFEGRIYLTALDGEQLQTLCLSADTGDILWRRTAPRPNAKKVDGRNHPASPSPVVGREGVFVFFPEYGLLAYDHFSEELWRVPLGPFDNGYGMGASPILLNGKVLLACDQNLGSYLAAFSAEDGEELWRVARPEASSGHCTPIVHMRQDGSAEVLMPGSFLLDSYDPDSGERNWFASGLCFEMKSVPVLWNGQVFTNGYGSPMNQPGNQVTVPDFADMLAAEGDGGNGQVDKDEMPEGRAAAWFSFMDLDHSDGLNEQEWGYLQRALASQNGLLSIRLGGSGDVTESHVNWAYRRSIPQLPSPLIYGDVLYLLADGGGLWTSLNPATGEVIERTRIAGGEDNYYASPVAADGKIYLASLHGLLTVLAAGEGSDPLSVVDLEEKIYATPALAPGRVYVRTEKALYCFGSK
ncbi:MAG: outer membrane protein assembly factor BamB [Planctomycetota bacterium]|jgi:outer membrane protein assembly factor BamB